jgi:hypothetical protein
LLLLRARSQVILTTVGAESVAGAAMENDLELVHRAIGSGIFGNIEWKDSARDLIRRNPEMNGLAPDVIRRLLHDFVQSGGRVDERPETRIEYQIEYSCWYRALMPISGFPRPLFVELVLSDDDDAEPFVTIVSAHF